MIAPAPPFSAWERNIAGRYLRAKRSQGGVALISIIAYVGITLAVAVLIIVMSVMNGFRSELISKILGFNGHVYVMGDGLSPEARDQMVKRIRTLPGVIQAEPVVETQALAQGPLGAAGAIVRGVEPSDLAATRIVSDHIKPGSLKGFGEGEDGGDVVIVGTKLAESLGVGVGDPISITSPSGGATAFGTLPTRKTYTVGGLFTVGMSEYDQAFVYMPLSQAQLFFGRGTAVDFIEVNLDDPDKVAAVTPLLRPIVGANTPITDWTEKNKNFFEALMVERNVMGLILACLVVIAAMNIISGLIMLVKNKSRDIAILRTMGASRGAILRIFLMAGATIGVLGTFTGLLLSVLFCANIEAIQTLVENVTGQKVFNADVYFLAHVPAKLDWGQVVIVAVGSTAAAFVASVFPAWQASRLDPVEALRYE
ncbi:lipoprotein-releasing ABC transporter permease subunit [Caulobacter sp. KR2-114]|uniref:lipoprotein-releasing ABC transporter permease subunit n=1 Tax=Caulobacter sp. KR2-114 TaxID=3400912 RepID=UPI003C06308C